MVYAFVTFCILAGLVQWEPALFALTSVRQGIILLLFAILRAVYCFCPLVHFYSDLHPRTLSLLRSLLCSNRSAHRWAILFCMGFGHEPRIYSIIGSFVCRSRPSLFPGFRSDWADLWQSVIPDALGCHDVSVHFWLGFVFVAYLINGPQYNT
jgi:hypothetical protein